VKKEEIEVNKFDRILKENFEGLTPFLLHSLTGIEPSSVTVIPAKIHRTLEREVDILLKIKSKEGEKYILNVEWQSTNDPNMCRRMLLYHSMVHIEEKLPVRGIVIYIGEEKMNMPKIITDDNIHFTYEQIDMTDLDPEQFLKSDIPDEVILAVLAGRTKKGEKTPVIREIFFKLHSLLGGNGPELARRIGQFEILGKLRGVEDIIKEEEINMAITYDIETDRRYKQGLEVGIEKGIEKAEAQTRTIVLNLLQQTDLPDLKIASLVDVPLDFVRQIKNDNL
jgi:predicted transposase/invertase (TIGR01784 family)